MYDAYRCSYSDEVEETRFINGLINAIINEFGRDLLHTYAAPQGALNGAI
jgi:hypothetical protein